MGGPVILLGQFPTSSQKCGGELCATLEVVRGERPDPCNSVDVGTGSSSASPDCVLESESLKAATRLIKGQLWPCG